MCTKTNKNTLDQHLAQKYLDDINNGEEIIDSVVDEVTGKVILNLYQLYLYSQLFTALDELEDQHNPFQYK